MESRDSVIIATVTKFYKLKAKKAEQKAKFIEAIWENRHNLYALGKEGIDELRRTYAPDLSVQDLNSVADTIKSFFPASGWCQFLLSYLRDLCQRGPMWSTTDVLPEE